MKQLAGRPSLAAVALRFVILTCVRTSEALNAKWSEVDLERAIWVIPASRMKAGEEHRVPLAPEVVTLLRKLRTGYAGSEYLFPSSKAGKPLSNMSMLALLRRMGRDDLTVHGFRSTFRTWAAEKTTFPREICEAALAHAVGSAVERAYQKSDFFERRAKLMNAWATFVTGGATVIRLAAREK